VAYSIKNRCILHKIYIIHVLKFVIVIYAFDIKINKYLICNVLFHIESVYDKNLQYIICISINDSLNIKNFKLIFIS
jgi:hypothetical protein